MKRLPLLLMASLATASVAFATTYVRVEKDGTKTYSDRPIPGGQPVEIQSAQTYSTPPQTVTAGSSDLTEEQRQLRTIDDFTYSSCSLSPENDMSFTNPERVVISVNTSPDVRPGDTVNLVVDGQAAAPYAREYTLEPANRGTHSATVTLKNQNGRVLCSASVSFHVMRPSLNMPGRG
jgi:hypothetical protein